MNIVAIRPAPIGDSLITFPVLTGLRKQYAHTHIAFVSNPAALPLAQVWGLADEVLNSALVWQELLSREGIRNAELRAMLEGCDLAICWMRDDDGLIRRNLLAAGAREVIIGPETRPLYASKHMVEYLGEPLGMHNLGEGYVLPWPDKKNEPSLRGPVAIHPGCSDGLRRWPTSAFAVVVKQLLRLGCPVLLLAGEYEAALVKDIERLLPRRFEPGLLAVLQSAPMLEVARHISQARCYLGNDTGITHLAGLLGTPTVVLFGSSDPIVMRPLGPSVEVIQKEPLKRLSAGRVLKSVLRYV